MRQPVGFGTFTSRSGACFQDSDKYRKLSAMSVVQSSTALFLNVFFVVVPFASVLLKSTESRASRPHLF